MPDYLDILNKYGLNKTNTKQKKAIEENIKAIETEFNIPNQPKNPYATNAFATDIPSKAAAGTTTNAAKAAIQSLIQNAVHGVKSTFYTLGSYLKGESIYSRKATLESLKSGQSTIVDLSSASQFGIPPSYYVVKSTDKPEDDGKTEKKGNETTVYVYKPKLEQEIKTLSAEYDEQIAKAIKEQSIIQEQKSIYAQTPFQKLVWDVAGMAYQTVGSVATVGLTSAIGVPQLGLAAVFASTAAREGASLYLQGIESGIEHNDMATQSMIVGAVNGLVEMWGVGELVQWLSKPITSTAGKTAVDALVKKGLLSQAITKQANIKFVEDAIVSGVSEGLEEVVQGYASDIGLSSAQQKTARETTRTMAQNTPEHLYEFFIASLWGGADVAVNKVVGNYTRNAAAEIIDNRAEEMADNIVKNVGGDKEEIKKEVIKQVSNIAKATGNALSEAHKQLSEEDKKELAKVVKPEDLDYLKYLIMKTEGKAGLTKEDINNINQWVKKNLPTYLQNKAKDVDAIREIIDKAMKEEVKPVTLSAAINNLTAISKELDTLNEVKIPKTALPTFNEIQSKIRQAIVDIHSNKNVLTQYKNIVSPLGQLTQTYLDLTKKAGQVVEEAVEKEKAKEDVVATLDDLIETLENKKGLAGEAGAFIEISRDFANQNIQYKGQTINVPVTFSLLTPFGEQYTEKQLKEINNILTTAKFIAERKNKTYADINDIAAALKQYKKMAEKDEEVAKAVEKAVGNVVKQTETTTPKAVEVSTEETVEVKPTEKVAEVQPVAEEPVSVQPTTKKITEKRTLHIPLSEDRLNTILQLLEKIRNVDRNSEARRAIEVLHDMCYAKTVEQIDAILKRAEEYLNKTEPAENPIPFSREEMLIRDITKWVKDRKVPTVYEKGKQSKATEEVETPAAPIETEKTVTQNVPEEAPTEVPPLQEETTAGVDEKEQKIRELQEQIPEDNREVKANIIKVDTTKYVTDATLKRIKLAESEIKEEQFKPSEIENYFGDLPSFIRGVLDKKHPSNGYAIFWGTLGDAFRNRALRNIDLEDLNQVPNDILKTRMNFQISDIVTPSKSYFQYMESKDGVGLAVFSNFKNQVTVFPSYVALVEEIAKENKISGAWYNDSDFLYFVSGNKVLAALTSIEIEKFDYPPYRFPASEYPYLKPTLEENEFEIDQELGRTLRATKEEKEIIIKKNEELKEADKEKQLTPEETKKTIEKGVKKGVLSPREAALPLMKPVSIIGDNVDIEYLKNVDNVLGSIVAAHTILRYHYLKNHNITDENVSLNIDAAITMLQNALDNLYEPEKVRQAAAAAEEIMKRPIRVVKKEDLISQAVKVRQQTFVLHNNLIDLKEVPQDFKSLWKLAKETPEVKPAEVQPVAQTTNPVEVKRTLDKLTELYGKKWHDVAFYTSVAKFDPSEHIDAYTNRITRLLGILKNKIFYNSLTPEVKQLVDEKYKDFAPVDIENGLQDGTVTKETLLNDIDAMAREVLKIYSELITKNRNALPSQSRSVPKFIPPSMLELYDDLSVLPTLDDFVGRQADILSLQGLTPDSNVFFIHFTDNDFDILKVTGVDIERNKWTPEGDIGSSMYLLLPTTEVEYPFRHKKMYVVGLKPSEVFWLPSSEVLNKFEIRTVFDYAKEHGYKAFGVMNTQKWSAEVRGVVRLPIIKKFAPDTYVNGNKINIESFKKDLKEKTWGIFTASNPNMTEQSPQANAEANKKMWDYFINTMHLKPEDIIRTYGIFGGIGDFGYLIFDIDYDTAININKMFGQGYACTYKGLTNLETGELETPFDLDKITIDDKLDDNFTQVLLGGKTIKYQIGSKEETSENKIENAGTTKTISNATSKEFIDNVKIAWQKSKPEKSSQPDPLDNQIAYLKPEDVRYLFNKAKEYLSNVDEAEMQKANKVIKKLLNKELLAEREQEVIRLHKQQIEIEKGLAESPKTPQEELQAFKGIEAEDVMLDITPEEAELLLKRWLQERSQYEEYFAQHAGLIRRMDEIIIKLQTYPEALTESEMKTVMEAFPSIFKKEIKAKPANILGQALAFVKILKVSFDLSMAGRQGITMIGHPLLYLNAVYRMIRAADPIHGEEYFAKLMEQMKQHPDWNLAVMAQLQITEAEDVYTAIHNTLDLLTKGKYNPIRISERNAQAFLYYIRFSEFEYLMNLYRKAGIEPNAEIRNEIANFVNTITGRGDIKALPNAVWTIGSYVLYSPRLMASRVALMNPWTYLRLVFSEGGKYRVVGKEAIKMMAAFLAFIFGSLWLVKKLIPDSYVETDPTSADFGKFRVGNVHYDVTGGFAAYVVFISRMITGRLTSSTTLIPRFYGSQWGQGTKLDTLVRFAQSKLDPVLGLGASLLAGETYSGDPIPPMKQLLKPMEGKDFWYNLANHPIYSLATPLVLSDLIDLIQNDDEDINKFLYAIDLFGFGTQAYSVDITKSVQENYNNLLKAGVSPQEATKRISYLKALNAYKQELNYLKNDTTLDEKTKKARLELLQKRLELARKVFIGGEK